MPPWAMSVCCSSPTFLLHYSVKSSQMHYHPEEPFVEELEGKDTLEFPPPPEAPWEDDTVIPSLVLDALMDAPDEVAMASVKV